MLDRNRRDILIRFDAQTNLPNFTGSTYRNISRSYAEFQQFYESIIQSNPQTIVPALPLAQTSAPTDEEDDRLVRIMLQRWLTRVCEDPFLMHDEETRSFIESDFGYQPMPRNPRRKAGSGFSLIKRGVPDEDETLQRARFELTKLEGQFFDAAKAIDKLSRVRKSLSVAQAEMGNKLVNVATTEVHPPLASALRKLGRTWHSISDLDQAAAISECVIVGDSLGYQGMNAKSAKETLLQRTSVLEEYQAAVKASISKRRQIERLKASSSINRAKVDEALEDMEEANKYEQILCQRVDGISHNLHLALDRHNKLVNEDVTAALIEHARSMISYERQRLRELESLRPDFKAADSKFIPATTGPPRPAFIPKLEDDIKPAPPVRSSPVAPQNPPLGTAASFRPPHLGPVPPIKTVVTGPLPPQSPGAGPSTPTNPHSSRTGSPFLPAPTPSAGPPLGGRLVDGTKSMFITPTSPSASSNFTPALAPTSPTYAPNGPPSPTPTVHTPSAATSPSPLTPTPSVYHETDPLGPLGSTAQVRRTVITSSFASPLGPDVSSSNVLPNGHVQRDEVDPLGLGKPRYMSQSMHLPPKPQRPRLDAREAASKLANMF
ncbi:Vps5 C terminal like-domain-containing protein [Phellopilus nigrolimitatus]|nr:Vps5 C terminal like-domain-containing protein [Phellopilus nigrolimitatus]